MYPRESGFARAARRPDARGCLGRSCMLRQSRTRSSRRPPRGSRATWRSARRARARGAWRGATRQRSGPSRARAISGQRRRHAHARYEGAPRTDLTTLDCAGRAGTRRHERAARRSVTRCGAIIDRPDFPIARGDRAGKNSPPELGSSRQPSRLVRLGRPSDRVGLPPPSIARSAQTRALPPELRLAPLRRVSRRLVPNAQVRAVIADKLRSSRTGRARRAPTRRFLHESVVSAGSDK